MKAHLVDTEVPEDSGFASLRDAKLHVFEHTYKLEWDALVFSDERLSDFDSPLQVLLECTFRQNGFVVAEAHWVVSEALVHDLIPPTVSANNPMEDAANEEADQSTSMLLWAQFPWLMASWGKLGHDPAARPSESKPSKSWDLGNASRRGHWFCGLTVEEVMSQQEVRRAELAGSTSRLVEHFRICVRGSNWTPPTWECR